MASINELMAQQQIRSYEISIWTLQDRFLSVLKWPTMNQKGQIQEPEMVLRDDGTQELTFTIPKYYWTGANKVQNPMWLHLQNQPLEANMHKLKVIFNKQTEDEEVFEFLVTSAESDHTQDRVDLNIKAEGLAFHELGKVGYKIALSQTNFELLEKAWAEGGMLGERPRENIQYWNDLVFKDSSGNWRTNWTYKIEMDWSSYSRAEGKRADCVYEDEYVSSWQLNDEGDLAPRLTEGYREKWRPIKVSGSNIYNVTQTIAEQFGVFCRYEYGHDENYQITTRTVVYYNNYIYDKEGHVDLTYPYTSTGITRTVDNSSVTTKLYVQDVDNDSGTISIMDVDANKSRENYLLCFDYLKDAQAINDEQYEEIEKYEARMYYYNTELSKIQERIRVLTDQLVDLEAEIQTYSNALALDDERYEEASRGLQGVTNGRELVPVDSTFTVMQDDERGFYIRMRFEGMKRESIHLYMKSNFSSLTGDQYSNPLLSWEYEIDPTTNDIVRLIHLQHPSLEEGCMVYLQGERDPYSYYETLMKIWGDRKKQDQEKLDKATELAKTYKWYLYGSRAGYALADLAIAGAAYYGLAITCPIDEEYIDEWVKEHPSPYINFHTDESRVGNVLDKDINIIADDLADPFVEMDDQAETADLIYLRDYYLTLKEREFNKFERMMGPALREGYWQPDDYHDYGDVYDAEIQNIRAGKVTFDDNELQAGFDRFIEGSDVWATEQEYPFLQFIWDCDKYYDNEEPLIYTSSISNRKDQHLVVDLSNCLSRVSSHLDDLCFFYSYPSNVATIYDIQNHKIPNVEETIRAFSKGIYNKTSTVGTNYFSKLEWFLDPLLKAVATETKENKPYLDEQAGAARTKLNLINIELAQLKAIYNGGFGGTSLLYAVQHDPADLLDSLSTCAELAYEIQTIYESVKAKQNSQAMKQFADDCVPWLKAIYNYLMVVNSSLTAWDRPLSDDDFTKDKKTKGYSEVDCGLIPIIKQYKLYNEWIDTLKNSRYCSYQVKSQCELGWVLDTQPQFSGTPRRLTGARGTYTRIPALIVTAANVLDDESIYSIVQGKYKTSKVVADGGYETSWITIPDREYMPFLGYYETIENNDGTKTLKPRLLYQIRSSDFIGAGESESIGATRDLVKADYDLNGQERYPEDDEYRYRRVYPRLFFNTLKLKNNSSDLYINLNGSILDSFEDYSVVQDDRSKAQDVRGVGYYVTLKPEVLFARGSSAMRLNITYTLSNADISIYLDALKIARENAYPKVSYDVRLSVLNPNFIRTAYRRLNQIVHINDNDLQLEEVSGYISEVRLKLDKVWEDTVEIKNYETKFEDLFTTIVAQTEAMKKSSIGLDSAVQAFSRTTGLIDSDVLYNSMLNSNLSLSFNKGNLTIDQAQGIWGTSEDGVVAFRGGGIFTATEHDSNGNWIWNTGILPSGINASLITTGQLDTNKIKVYAGDELRFQLNGDGLYAYKSFTSESSDILLEHPEIGTSGNIDANQYVVFNSEGMFLHAKAGTLYSTGTTTLNTSGKNVLSYKSSEADVDRVEISWDGLILRNWNNERVFYADPDTGNLTLNGTIYAVDGKIGGWRVSDHSFIGRYIELVNNEGNSSEDGIYLYENSLENVGASIIHNNETYYAYTTNGDIQTYYISEGVCNGVQSYTTKNTDAYLYYASVITAVSPRNTIIEAKAEQGATSSNQTQSGGTISTKTNGEDESTSTTTVSAIRDNNATTANGVIYTYTVAYVATTNNQKATDVNGQPIQYNGVTSPSADWYQKLVAAGKTDLAYITMAPSSELSEIQLAVGTVMKRYDFQPTFSVVAKTGAVTINNGAIANFAISKSGLSNGTLLGGNAKNFALESGTISTYNVNKYGNCFCDISANSTAGIFTLTRVNGQTANFNIADMAFFKNQVAAANKIDSLVGAIGRDASSNYIIQVTAKSATTAYAAGYTFTKVFNINSVYGTGYDTGYSAGYSNGKAHGGDNITIRTFTNHNNPTVSASYVLTSGVTIELTNGVSEDYNVIISGKEAYDNGYTAGWNAGYSKGYASGYSASKSTGSGGCFIAGTPILINHSTYIPIEQL